MSQVFSAKEIEDIILDNQDMMLEDGEYFDVEDLSLAQIFSKINTCDGVSDPKQLIVKRAAYILSTIVQRQPFSGANRRSAYSATMYFLRKNNLNIPLNTIEQEKEIFKLLDKTKRKTSIDASICSEVEAFLSRRVTDYTRSRRLY